MRCRFFTYSWPWRDVTPRLYYDARADSADTSSTMHAKCVVVDGRRRADPRDACVHASPLSLSALAAAAQASESPQVRWLAMLVIVGCSSRSPAPDADDAGIVRAEITHRDTASPAPVDAPPARMVPRTDVPTTDARADGGVAPSTQVGFMLGGAMPLGARFISLTHALFDAAGPGAVGVDVDSWAAIVVRRIDPSADVSALRGLRLSVFDRDGTRCAATVEDVYAVRTLEVPFELRRQARDPAARATIENQLWSAAIEGYVAVSATGCDGVFAVPAGAPRPRITKLTAASAEVDTMVKDAFERGRGQDLDAKAELEDRAGVPWTYISTRTLAPEAGAALGIAYVKIFGTRTVALFPLPPIGDNWPLAEVAAKSPSSVLGIDADADGVVDALLSHPDGTALYLSRTERLLSLRDGVPVWSK